MSFYDDLKSGLTYIIDTGADIYKEQLKQETAQDELEAQQQVAQQVANDTIMIGDTKVSVTKTLLIVVTVLGVALILRK